MRRLLKTLSLSSILFISLAALFLLLTLSLSAKTPRTPELNHTDLIKLKKELSQNNPLKRRSARIKKITITERNINQGLLLYLTNFNNIPIHINLHEGYATVSASPAISVFSTTLYSNIKFSASLKNGKIKLDDIYIGLVPVPTSLVNMIYPYAEKTLSKRFPNYQQLLSSVKKVTVSHEKLSVIYRWNWRIAQQAKQFGKNLLFNKETQTLISIYYDRLTAIPPLYLRKETSMHTIIRTLFRHAKQRVAQGNDPVIENKAVLLTLGLFASGVRVNSLINSNRKKYAHHLYFGRVTLLGRTDLMRHFLISAALTVSTNKILSDTIGLSKEFSDADGGSGFSFADLLADRAGVSFAQMAIDPKTATLFLRRITKQDLSALDIMPPYTDMPESISALEFEKRYVNIENPKYQFIESEIKRRISALPLHST